jgi:hypothetical protein
MKLKNNQLLVKTICGGIVIRQGNPASMRDEIIVLDSRHIDALCRRLQKAKSLVLANSSHSCEKVA